MTMITPSYLGETIEYSSLHACRSTLEDPTDWPLTWSGLAAVAAPLAFYRAMTLASLSLVMPIAAAYPALIVPVRLASGELPAVLEWRGMGLTGVGAMGSHPPPR